MATLTKKRAQAILKAKADYKKAAAKGDKVGMIAAHQRADVARGYATKYEKDIHGRAEQVQSGKLKKSNIATAALTTDNSLPTPKKAIDEKVNQNLLAAAKKSKQTSDLKKAAALQKKATPAALTLKPTGKLASYVKQTAPTANQGGVTLDIKNMSAADKKQVARNFVKNYEAHPVLKGIQHGFDPTPSKGASTAFNAGQLEAFGGNPADLTKTQQSTPYKIGSGVGTGARYTLEYMSGAKGITAATKALPAIAKLSPLARNIVGSAAADLAIGVPANINEASAEGLKGKEAAKNVAKNTALFVGTGGLLEAVPFGIKALKNMKNAAKAEELKAATQHGTPQATSTPAQAAKLPTAEAKPVQQPSAPIAQTVAENTVLPATNNVVKGKAATIKKQSQSELFEDEYNRTVDSVYEYLKNYKGKGADTGIIPKGNDYGAEEFYRMGASNNDQWYQDFYRENGRVPNKGELKALAEKLVTNDINNPHGEFYNPELSNILKQSTEYIPAKPISESELPDVERFYSDLKPKSDAIKRLDRLGDSTLSRTKETSRPAKLTAQNDTLKDLGADTNRTEKTIGQLNQEYGTIPKGELPRARNVNVPKATQYGETSQYVRTLKESPIVGDQLNKKINDEIIKGSFAKSNISNKTVVDDANTMIQKEGLDNALSRFNAVSESGKQPTSYDIALGNRVLQELQRQGGPQEALNTAVKLIEALSESGRTLQAAKIAKRLSPEGRLTIVARAQKKLSDSSGTNINLPDNIITAVRDARTEKEIIQANQDAAIAMWNQVPASFTEKANAWRYMSMLFNPKTQARNLVGNAIFVPTREFKNLIGTAIERPTLKVGERTKAVLVPGKDKNLIDFAKNDFSNVDYILKNEGKYDDAIRPQEAKIFNNKVLETLRKFNMDLMNKVDLWFMNSAYSGSLAQYMKANKISPANMVGDTLDKGRAYAMNEALKATYRDFNSFANLLSRASNTLSKGDASSPLANFGKKTAGFALEGAFPFKKTPLNIMKRGIAYSPAGIARGIANMGTAVRTGKISASEAIDQLASGISGTGLLGLGMLLGYNGIVNGKEGQYGDKSYDYNQMLGVQDYSLSINGKSYTLDWAAPDSMPFFVGVELAKAVKNNDGSLGNVFDAMTQISDPMINLSMVKGINDLVKNNFTGIGDTALDLGLGYVGQFIPTLGGQIARTIDNTRRDTTSTNEVPTLRALQKFGMKQIAKLPFASKSLQPYVDMWGRPQKNGNAAENFLSPGYYAKENVTDVDKELLSLKSDLGDKWNDVLPSKVSQYVITSNSMPYRMNESELTAYKTTRGKTSYSELQTLFKSDAYKNMTSDDKAAAIKEVYDNATEAAKVQYFKSKGLPVTNALSKTQQDKYAELKKQIGMNDKEYYSLYKTLKVTDQTSDYTDEYDNAKSVVGKFNLANNAKYSDKQKSAISAVMLGNDKYNKWKGRYQTLKNLGFTSEIVAQAYQGMNPTSEKDQPAVAKKFNLANNPSFNYDQKNALAIAFLDSDKYDEWGADCVALKSKGLTDKDVGTLSLNIANGDSMSDKHITKKGTEASISAGSKAEKGGQGKSASWKKKTIIDNAYPNADRETLETLYSLFGISPKVWNYKK